MTCMSSLTSIAKLRPNLFFASVITALEMLHANLPPTLAKSQVSSVRKHLKNQLLALLKTGQDQFLTNMTTLLYDLGASKEDIHKVIPDLEKRKRKETEILNEVKNKKAKIDTPDEDSSEEESEQPEQKTLQESAVDITEKFIQDRFNFFE